MDDLGSRFVMDMIGREGGPFYFRFILQPAMAMCYALRDGLGDARAGRPPYLSAILHDQDRRGGLLQQGFKAVGRVVAIGLVMDALYQAFVLKGVRPLELIVVVIGLAFVPYLLLRGPINRIARRWV